MADRTASLHHHLPMHEQSHSLSDWQQQLKQNILSPVDTYLVWIDYLTGCYDSAMRFVSSIDLYTVDLLKKLCNESFDVAQTGCVFADA